MSKGRFLLIFILGIAVFGSLAWYSISYLSQQHTIASNVQTIPQVAGNTTTDTGLPVRLSIPSINVDAPIIYVGLAADGSVGVPAGPDQVAWFDLGPKPGQKGSAIITGHFGPWRSGAQSVFNNLDKLKQGDRIYVIDDKGTSLSFEVTGSHAYNPNESVPEVFNKNNGTYLNLITCNGDWLASQKTYTKRLVVFANAVKS